MVACTSTHTPFFPFAGNSLNSHLEGWSLNFVGADTCSMDNVLHTVMEPDLFMFHLDFLVFPMTFDIVAVVGNTSFYGTTSCIFDAVGNNFDSGFGFDFDFHFYLHLLVKHSVVVGIAVAFHTNKDCTSVDLEELVEFAL